MNIFSPETEIHENDSVVKDKILNNFKIVRETTEQICKPLMLEDYVVQPIVDVSPPKWHLGHSTWFFENFILKEFKPGYKVFDKDFGYVFNSYYEHAGDRVLRTNRGNMTRPGVENVYQYRKYVNEQILELLEGYDRNPKILELVELGLNHEQQHQELLVTDIKYILGNNPLFPVYSRIIPIERTNIAASEMLQVEEGIYEIGYNGNGFFFDNEKGRHKVYLHSYEIMSQLVTNEEYLEFIEAGAYKDFRFWLSEGWEWVNVNNINAPLYWFKIENEWHRYSLGGMQKIDPKAPVTHISYFEADAYAAWKGLRLPTEAEWEVACGHFSPEIPIAANFLENRNFDAIASEPEHTQFFGDVWEWTSSSYLPYPFYKKEAGALGEYNGKFMVNQMVLRGGSCATPRNHIRPTYRNFWATQTRFQFTGLRLAKHIS